MADELRLLLAFGLALGGALAATPVAIAFAARTNFHDRPAGYKGHASPTPYLGGAAVLGGFLVATFVLGGEFEQLRPIVVWTCALWFLGTLDDRFGLPAWPRLLAECVAGLGLWTAGLGWNVFGGDILDVALTLVWVVGLVNAFNLIDNMDGAAATLAAVTGAAIGALALVEGDLTLAVIGAGLAGACAGFLPYNLAAPSRIFLGDGGSLPIGFIIAASLMALPTQIQVGDQYFLVAVLLAGLPILDTTLVMVSRRRAGISILTAGRDHLTHRLRMRLGAARTVALVLGLAQACLCALAIGVVQLGNGSVLIAWSFWFAVGTATIVVLEGRAWAPARDFQPVAPEPSSAPLGSSGPVGPTSVEIAAIAIISVACGLSPFLYGFYDVSVWGPIALGMLAVLLGLLIARPAAPRRTALAACAGLAGFWLWSLFSSRWAESADQALIEANRWLLYVAMFCVLVLLLRIERSARLVLASASAAIGALALYLLVRMLAGTAPDLFLDGRLHEPLGYVNGQAGFLLLGLWPMIALAERTERAAMAGAALAGATLLLSLALLGQSRAVLPALGIAAAVLVVAVPGRLVRIWAIAFVLGGVLLSLGPVLDVYDAADGGSPDAGVLREAGVAILFAAGAVGTVWGGAAYLTRRLTPTSAARVRRAASATVAAALIGSAVVLLISVGDPVDRVRAEYRSFVNLETQADTRTRFTTGAGHRYDYWRVALGQFADHPLHGIGAGNYDTTYFRERRTAEDIRQPHSIELQTLAETGLVGLFLLVLFVGAVLGGFVRRARAAVHDPVERGLAVGAGGVFLVWLVHTSVDWLHLIPGVTGVALCAAAVLTGPWRRAEPRPDARRRGFVVVVGAALVLLAGVFVGRAALADRLVDDGRSRVASDPIEALAKATDSLALNDEALPAYYLRAAAWARLDDYPRARRALVEATRREPHDPVPWGLLGDLATRRGLSREARAAYAHALSLNPRDPALGDLARAPTPR